MQGKFAVEVDLEGIDIDDEPNESGVSTSHKELRVYAVHIADRPPGLFAPAEKSHTTAWAVYTDQLRNAVLGRTVAGAVKAVHDLYTDAQNLPGVARAANLSGTAKATYDGAKKKMDDLVKVKLSSLAEERHVDLLQRLAKWFLSYRNAVPLSQMDIGRATGHGEPEVLRNLRPTNDLREGWEANPDEADAMRLQGGVAGMTRRAMWSLLDEGTISSFFSLAATSESAPGIADGDGGAAARIADLVTQHLWTLEATYETAFRAAEMDSEESIRAYLLSAGCRGLYQDLIYKKIKAHYDNAPEKTSEENEDRLLTPGPAGQGLFSVQVSTAKDGKVTELYVGSRAPTLLGSAQGSHTTAWLVYVDAVRNVVVGQSYVNAVGGVLKLCEAALALPGMKRTGLLDAKQKYWFEMAFGELKRAMGAAKGVVSKLEVVPALQRLIKAYLGFRNAVPLSQIKGGLADGNAEAHYRAKMRYLESGYTEWTGIGGAPAKDPRVYREAFWELYDYSAMAKAVRHEVEPEDAPGIHKDENGFDIAGDSIRQHLVAMQQAYPKSFDVLAAGSDESIRYVLNKMNIRDEYYDGIIARVKS